MGDGGGKHVGGRVLADGTEIWPVYDARDARLPLEERRITLWRIQAPDGLTSVGSGPAAARKNLAYLRADLAGRSPRG
jgi:hypothetical protein